MKPTRILAGAGRLLGAILLLACSSCSIFEFSEYESFGDWLVGPPGWSRAINGNDESEGIRSDRPVIYGPFRLPEVIFQPSGGLTYPVRRTITNSSMMDAFAAMGQADSQARTMGYGSATYRRVTRVERGPTNSLAFDWWDAGAIEILPYRTWAADEGVGYKIGMTALQPLNTTMNLMMSVVRAPVYAVHDVVKLLTMPFAAFHFAGRDDPGKPAAAQRPAGATGDPK